MSENVLALSAFIIYIFVLYVLYFVIIFLQRLFFILHVFILYLLLHFICFFEQMLGEMILEGRGQEINDRERTKTRKGQRQGKDIKKNRDRTKSVKGDVRTGTRKVKGEVRTGTGQEVRKEK